MRILETNSIGLGIPLRMLMEAAGKNVADYIASKLSPEEAGRVVVMFGKGGNGGDGLVAARYLSRLGYCVELLPAYPLEAIGHPDTRANLDIVLRLESIKMHKYGNVDVIDGAGVIVDALLGTGVRGKLRGIIRDYVEKANSIDARLKVAIDTPTGLNPDTGEIHGIAFKADATVTMHDIKPGLLKNREYVGEIIVANIGIPPDAWLFVGPGDVVHGIPGKPKDAHKGMGGRILVVGGSRYYTGAPALAGVAALSVGADLSFVIVPETIRGVIASYTPEIITATVPGDHFKPSDLEILEKYIAEFRPHTIVFGNGLGRDPETIDFAMEFIKWVVNRRIPIVIDADGLKGIMYGRMKLAWKAIVTPHRGEFKALTGEALKGDPWSDIEKLIEASKALEATILLKAPIDVIVYGDNYRFNRTGNQGMTIGGTGDVLAGIAGAVYAKTNDPFESASIAAYLNGLAGDYIYYIEKDNPSPARIVEVLSRIINNVLDTHLTTYSIEL